MPQDKAQERGASASGFDPSRRLEFRPDSDGNFDEIVARYADGMVHVETLSDQGCYVGIYWDDGRYCQWWIGCTGRGKLTYSHEDGQGPPPRFTTWGIDTRPEEPLSDAMRAAIAMETRQGGNEVPSRSDDRAGPKGIAHE